MPYFVIVRLQIVVHKLTLQGEISLLIKMLCVDSSDNTSTLHGQLPVFLLSHCRNGNKYTGYTQKNGAVSKVNKKFISHLTWTQRTPSAAATVQVSRFSRLLRGQFPRWRSSRQRLSVCSVLRCPDL